MGGGGRMFKNCILYKHRGGMPPPADTSKEEEAILSSLYDQLSLCGVGGGLPGGGGGLMKENRRQQQCTAYCCTTLISGTKAVTHSICSYFNTFFHICKGTMNWDWLHTVQNRFCMCLHSKISTKKHWFSS